MKMNYINKFVNLFIINEFFLINCAQDHFLCIYNNYDYSLFIIIIYFQWMIVQYHSPVLFIAGKEII